MNLYIVYYFENVFWATYKTKKVSLKNSTVHEMEKSIRKRKTDREVESVMKKVGILMYS